MLKSTAILFFLANALAAAQLPLAFEPNVGQARDDVSFVSRAGADSFALLHGGSFRIDGIEVRLAGANRHAAGTGVELLPGRSNYFAGPDPRRWHTDIQQFAEVRYRGVYPGIDLNFHGHEYDFVIAPHADPSRIRLQFLGSAPHLDSGDLIVPPFRQKRPQAYQIVDGKRREVTADFVLSGSTARFRLGQYDRRAPLVIDPVIVFATYLGGSGNVVGESVGVDAAGNIYVSGSSAVVTKLSPDGSTVLYSTSIAGASSVVMVVDASGNAYLAGSGTPPTTAGAYQTTPAAGFIAKLNPTGDRLLYSALISGYPSAIAIDSAGAAYVTGGTVPGSNFVTTAGAFQTTYTPGTCPIDDPLEPTECPTAFVLKLKPDGSAPVYATLLGGTGPDKGNAIAVDSGGNAIVAGSTASANFPVTANAIQPTYGGSYIIGPEVYGDAFVSKLNPTGSALGFSTFLGGSEADYATALALDPAGNIYVNGITQSDDFPTTPGSYEPTFSTGVQTTVFGPPATGFVAKIAPAGSLAYSTFIQGSPAIQVDQSGYLYLDTIIPPLPTNTIPYNRPVIAILNPAGSAIVSSGGTGVGASGSSAMVLDGKGYVYQTGQVGMGAFFATPGSAYPNYPGGNYAAYAIKISLSGSGPTGTTVFNTVNAATQGPGDYPGIASGTIAPGEIVTIYGAFLGPAVGIAAPAGAPAPTLLGGTRVLFDGTPAPLLWVGNDQINAVAPFEIAAPLTEITIQTNQTTYGPWEMFVVPTQPGIFTIDGSGKGQAAVINQDGTPNSATNPAAKGSLISIYATGAGLMNMPMTDGAVVSTNPPFATPQSAVLVEIGAVPAALQYAGVAPGLIAGALQVNVTVPESAASGDAVPLWLAIGQTWDMLGATVAIK